MSIEESETAALHGKWRRGEELPSRCATPSIRLPGDPARPAVQS